MNTKARKFSKRFLAMSPKAQALFRDQCSRAGKAASAAAKSKAGKLGYRGMILALERKAKGK